MIRLAALWIGLLSATGSLAQGPALVPVTTTTPSRQDVPVVARAIGTVQPFQTVVVRARVDGALDKVLFTEGQTVKAGDVLAQLDPRPYQAVLDQAVARRAADEAALVNSRADLVRYAELAQSQVTSRQRLDLQRANLAQAEASARGTDAAIDSAQLNLSFTRIVAPISGRVGLRMVDAGNIVRAADAASSGIVTITQVRPVALFFTMPQDALPQIQAATRNGKIPVTAFSSDDKVQLGLGEFQTVDSAIDQATGTIRLKATFPNDEEALWPGQFVNVRIRLGVRQDVITLPSVAVQRGQGGLFVYVVKPDNTAVIQPVEVEQDDGNLAVVGKGLTGTERIVLSGQSRLSDGARVSATDAKTSG